MSHGHQLQGRQKPEGFHRPRNAGERSRHEEGATDIPAGPWRESLPGDPESLRGPLANSVDMSLISFPSRIFTSQVGVLRRCAEEKALDVTVWREDLSPLFPSLGTFFAASGENPAGPPLPAAGAAAGAASPCLGLSSHLVRRTVEVSLSPLPGGPHPLRELGSWESERDNSPGKPKIALAKGGGCPGHQGLGRSLWSLEICLQGPKIDHLGRCRMTPTPPHTHWAGGGKASARW